MPSQTGEGFFWRRGGYQDFGRAAEETRLCLEELDPDGYLPCSCHFAQADTPVENIMALLETVQQYKR